MVCAYFRVGWTPTHGCCRMECARRFLIIMSNGINPCEALLIRWLINKGLLIDQQLSHMGHLTVTPGIWFPTRFLLNRKVIIQCLCTSFWVVWSSLSLHFPFLGLWAQFLTLPWLPVVRHIPRHSFVTPIGILCLKMRMTHFFSKPLLNSVVRNALRTSSMLLEQKLWHHLFAPSVLAPFSDADEVQFCDIF